MPDILDLLGKWWKQVLLIVILAVVAAAGACFLQRKQYLAVATAVPASTVGADKTRVFGENLQGLYSALGSPDDLDRVIGTAQLDTVYRLAARELQLDKHYNIESTSQSPVILAGIELKNNSRVLKSAYGELKVQVWDKDPIIAARLANSITQILETIHKNLQSAGNEATLKALIEARTKLAMYADSSGVNTGQSQMEQYDKLISQYQVLINSKPPALVVVEQATAPIRPDKPRMLRTAVAAAFLAFLFSILVVLVLERRSKKQLE